MKITRTSILLGTLLLGGIARGDDERTITVTLTVPDSAWTITIDEVHLVKHEIWVVSTVTRPRDMIGLQVITTLRASLTLPLPELPIRHVVIGKTWGWKNEEPYTFVKDRQQLEDDLKHGTVLYRRAHKNDEAGQP